MGHGSGACCACVVCACRDCERRDESQHLKEDKEGKYVLMACLRCVMGAFVEYGRGQRRKARMQAQQS